MSSKRISTGIAELDVMIEGGLRCGKTYLVVGEPGTGKTVFGLQFLASSLMDKHTQHRLGAGAVCFQHHARSRDCFAGLTLVDRAKLAFGKCS